MSRIWILVDVGEEEEEETMVELPDKALARCVEALRKPERDCSPEELVVAAATLKIIELPDNWRIKEEI